MRKVVVLGVALGMVLAVPLAAQAFVHTDGNAKYTLSLTEDYTPSPWTSQVTYGSRFLHKLGFGAKNLLLGWVDVLTEPYEAGQAGESLMSGIGSGLKDGLFNELGGAVHLVTSPITGLDAPLPEGGTALLSE